MEREIIKNNKIGYRIAIVSTPNGLRIASTGINETNGKELAFGHWASSTVENKIREFSKVYRIPKYNHYKDNMIKS